jgi:hypothetical protein
MGAERSAGAAPSCSVHWTGEGSEQDWNIAANWSTDTVPGPASDVCIQSTVYTYVFTTGHITVHSLRLSGSGGLELGLTTGAPIPSTFDATSFVRNGGSIGLYESTLESPHITSSDLNGYGLAASGGPSIVTSPDFTNTGDVAALGGTVKFTDVPTQLQGGALSGGEWDAFGHSVLQLHAGVTSLAGGSIGMVNGGQVLAGNTSAVGSLQSIGAASTLVVAGNSTPQSISGNLTSAGRLDLGDYYSGGLLTLGGRYTAQPGSQTTLGVTSRLTAGTIELQAGSAFSADERTVIQADVNNSGSFAVGGTTVSIAGNFTQTATGSLNAGGPFELAVSGHADLAGTLVVYMGIEPQQGVRTTAVTFASRTGDFTGHSLGVRVVPETTQIDVVTQPQIQLVPSSASPGSTLTVSGGDFRYGSTATLYLDDAGGTPLGAATVGIVGTFTASIRVPTGTMLGSHRIVALEGAITASAPVDVT